MVDEDVEADIRAQLHEALSGADYPVTSQMDLVPALPDGPATTFESGDVTISAMEMATKLGGHQEFPYENADDLVDDVMAALKAEDLL